ncbi:MAG: hypothetical protein V2A73_05195, partial [Pseudomonadota bacterium]
EQRSRRAILIERILRQHRFETDRRVDLVNARIRHLPAASMEERLVLLGLLTEYVNHLDMSLVSDRVLDEYEHAFLAGNYGYGRAEHAPA